MRVSQSGKQTQLLKESSTSQASDVFSPRFILSKYKLEIPVYLGSRHLHLKAGTNSQHMTELVGQTVSSAAELHEISPEGEEIELESNCRWGGTCPSYGFILLI